MSSTTCTEIITTESVDLLGRQEFVDWLLQVAETLSSNKKNACYAVNGAWGTGKTFVMNMFEQQAAEIAHEGTILPRYLVFHYNCWEYDYYEEPVIAILSSIIENIDEKLKLFDSDARSELKGILKAATDLISRSVAKLASDKLGFNVVKFLDLLKEGKVEAEKLKDTSFDPYFRFKEALTEVRDELKKITEYQTLIIVVDELDRCLPEYSIKVLERLHHLFEGIPNVQVILSIDKQQLEHAVRQIYGEKTDVNKYLAKFIKFQLELDIGSFEDKEKLQSKFNDYFSWFNYLNEETRPEDISDFYRDIFEEIDVRAAITIIEKSMLVHELLTDKSKNYDCSIMCIEVFLSVLQYCDVHISNMSEALHNGQVNFYISVPNDNYYKALKKISAKYSDRKHYSFSRKYGESMCYISSESIWGVLLAAYYIILQGKRFELQSEFGVKASYDDGIIADYVKLYWEMLRIIK